MAVNPQIAVFFRDGALNVVNNDTDQICLKVGAASDGAYLVPQYASSTNSVISLNRHGPLVRSASFHVDQSGPLYVMRCRASNPGSIGAVTKNPSVNFLGSLGALTIGVPTYLPHAAVLGGGGLTLVNAQLAYGWQASPMSLPLKIICNSAVVACTATVSYVDNAGNPQVEVLAIPGGVATVATAGDVVQVMNIVVSGTDPVGLLTFQQIPLGPGDQYQMQVRCMKGGVIGVTGGISPQIAVSLDNGITYGKTYSLPSTGVTELFTYSGGLVPQSTGQLATFSGGSLGVTVPGSIKLAGADENGDVVFNCLTTGVTVTSVIGTMGAALSAAVSAAAITITLASADGTTTTTTGLALAQFLQTSSSAGAIAARLLATAQSIGTGASLSTAQASTAATTGGVVVTPLVEGVQVRFVNGGVSKSLSVGSVQTSTTTWQVTLNVATDADGEQTTTATLAAAALNNDAVASTLLSAAVASGGSGKVGAAGVFFALPVSLATNDTFTWLTTPPTWSDSDLQAALAALYANVTWLSYYSILHVVGASDDTADNELITFITNCETVRKQFQRVIVEGTFQGSTAETTWINALIATYATTSPLYAIAAGECNILNNAYGSVDRCNVAAAYVARLMNCPISEDPAHTDCNTFTGIQQALPGVLVRPGANTQALWQSDDGLTTLNTSNFITLRQWPGRSGIYVRQGLQFTTNGSDYTYVMNARIADVAAALAYDEGLRFMIANLLVDPVTGQLAEAECQKLEAQITSREQRKLCGNDKGRQHVSAVQFYVARGQVYAGVGDIQGSVVIVPRQPLITFEIGVGFSATLTPASAPGS